MEKEIIINQSLNAKQIGEISTNVFFSSKLKYFYFLVVFCTLLSSFVPFLNLYDTKINQELDLTNFIFPIIFISVPFLFKNSIQKNAEKIFTEKEMFYRNMKYTLNSNQFIIEGDSYYNTYDWKNLHKIKETKKWFLIYNNQYQAIAIDKNQQKTETIKEIKQLFNSLSIKKSLMN